MAQPNESPSHREFLRLIATHEAAIRTFLRAILPSLADAEEVFQVTLITLWEKFGQYDDSRDYKSWAFGIAKYKAFSLMRDRQRERLVFNDALVERLADEAASSEHRYLTQREALDGCLRKLTPHLRKIVLQAYTKGTRMDQLAQSLGQTPMALYKKLHRIRRRLLECVKQSLAQEGAA